MHSSSLLTIGQFDIATLCEEPGSGHKGLYAAKSVAQGDIVCTFGAGEVLSYPTRFTVQAGDKRHIILYPEYLQYINHDCDPNIFFDTQRMQVEALKPIRAGEELLFFYPSTEWSMAEPFECLCGSPRCLQKIRGASVLPDSILAEYRLTAYILRKLKQRHR